VSRSDVGYNDPTVHSPSIDGLAREGVRLDACYTWSWCAPSRGAILSGRYPSMHGYQAGGDGGNDTTALDLRWNLLPQLLKQAGYRTSGAGKWHLGFPTKQHLPGTRGFESWLGYLTGAEDHYLHTQSHGGCAARDLWRVNSTYSGPERDPALFPRYSPYVFTQEAVMVIDGHDTAYPLFLYLPYQNVHGPNQVPDVFFDAYPSEVCYPAPPAKTDRQTDRRTDRWKDWQTD